MSSRIVVSGDVIPYTGNFSTNILLIVVFVAGSYSGDGGSMLEQSETYHDSTKCRPSQSQVGHGDIKKKAPNDTAYKQWSCHIGFGNYCANCVDTYQP